MAHGGVDGSACGYSSQQGGRKLGIALLASDSSFFSICAFLFCFFSSPVFPFFFLISLSSTSPSFFFFSSLPFLYSPLFFFLFFFISVSISFLSFFYFSFCLFPRHPLFILFFFFLFCFFCSLQSLFLCFFFCLSFSPPSSLVSTSGIYKRERGREPTYLV